jgi:hypothetical protein
MPEGYGYSPEGLAKYRKDQEADRLAKGPVRRKPLKGGVAPRATSQNVNQSPVQRKAFPSLQRSVR